jgi:hypothetical protein
MILSRTYWSPFWSTSISILIQARYRSLCLPVDQAISISCPYRRHHRTPNSSYTDSIAIKVYIVSPFMFTCLPTRCLWLYCSGPKKNHGRGDHPAVIEYNMTSTTKAKVADTRQPDIQCWRRPVEIKCLLKGTWSVSALRRDDSGHCFNEFCPRPCDKQFTFHAVLPGGGSSRANTRRRLRNEGDGRKHK